MKTIQKLRGYASAIIHFLQGIVSTQLPHSPRHPMNGNPDRISGYLFLTDLIYDADMNPDIPELAVMTAIQTQET